MQDLKHFWLIWLAIIFSLANACALNQLEVKPDVRPGQSVGVNVKSCFSTSATESVWGLGIPNLWNSINGCKTPESDTENEEEASPSEQV